jgi:uncharacterized membrane protein
LVAAEPTKAAAVLGVVVAPGLAHDVTSRVADELVEDLREHHGAIDWRTELLVDRLVDPPAPTTEILDAARRRLLEGDWDLGVVVTDLPLRLGRRPVSRHVSPTHGLAVVSLPALGAINLRPRLRRTLHELVGDLVGDRRSDDGVLQELASDTGARPAGLYVLSVLRGHVRLLLGMVRANRPWRLAAGLYRTLVAALAVAGVGLVTGDVWRLADAAGWKRLLALSAVSILATVVSVIAAHGLWERVPDPRVRDQVILFNFATTATVLIGIVSLYLALFALVLSGAGLVISSDVLAGAVGHDVGLSDYVTVAWFVASFATIGGALGAALESGDAVRQAAYAATTDQDEGSDNQPG